MKSTTNGDATSNGGPHATDIDNDNDAKVSNDTDALLPM